MKNKKLIKIQIIGVIITIILGTLLHFTYEWSGDNRLVGLFSSVNESTWEHLKLVFYPMLLISFIEYFWVKKFANNYIEAKTIGIVSAMAFIVVFFYTYTGIIGTDFAFVNILSYVVSIIIGEVIAYKLMVRENESTKVTKGLSLAIIFILFVQFVVFTYNPPRLNIFKDESITIEEK